MGRGGRPLALTIATTSPGADHRAAGVPAGIGIQGNLLSGTPLTSGCFPVTLTAGTMQRLMLFSIAPGTYDDLVIGAEHGECGAGAFGGGGGAFASLAGFSIAWMLSNAPSTLALTGTSATGATIAGNFTAYGTFPVVVTATGGTVPISKTITFVVAAPVPQTPLYLPWLHGDLSLIDLQFDLRLRGVQSYYATAGGRSRFMESDTVQAGHAAADAGADRDTDNGCDDALADGADGCGRGAGDRPSR